MIFKKHAKQNSYVNMKLTCLLHIYIYKTLEYNSSTQYIVKCLFKFGSLNAVLTHCTISLPYWNVRYMVISKIWTNLYSTFHVCKLLNNLVAMAPAMASAVTETKTLNTYLLLLDRSCSIRFAWVYSRFLALDFGGPCNASCKHLTLVSSSSFFISRSLLLCSNFFM